MKVLPEDVGECGSEAGKAWKGECCVGPLGDKHSKVKYVKSIV